MSHRFLMRPPDLRVFRTASPSPGGPMNSRARRRSTAPRLHRTGPFGSASFLANILSAGEDRAAGFHGVATRLRGISWRDTQPSQPDRRSGPIRERDGRAALPAPRLRSDGRSRGNTPAPALALPDRADPPFASGRVYRPHRIGDDPGALRAGFAAIPPPMTSP